MHNKLWARGESKCITEDHDDEQHHYAIQAGVNLKL